MTTASSFAAAVLVLASTSPASADGPVKRNVRLLMNLEMNAPTHESGANNTEDEILYITAYHPVGEDAFGAIQKRLGDPDIFEMGWHAATTLYRVVLEGIVASDHHAKVAIVVIEQEGEFHDEGHGQVTAATLEPFDDDLADAVLAARNRRPGYDEYVVAAQVTISPYRLSVVPAVGSKVIRRTPRAVSIKGDVNGVYTIHLRLVSADDPPPEAYAYLGSEYDDCGESLLKVHGSAGTVKVLKGQTKRVPIASQEFHWDCGQDSDDHSKARSLTQLLEVKRDKVGRQITWMCYRKQTLEPDIKW